MGGYESYTFEMAAFLKSVMRQTGILYDTTYSGKGLYGMMQELYRLSIRYKNIMFWHTGGIMNLLK